MPRRIGPVHRMIHQPVFDRVLPAILDMRGEIIVVPYMRFARSGLKTVPRTLFRPSSQNRSCQMGASFFRRSGGCGHGRVGRPRGWRWAESG